MNCVFSLDDFCYQERDVVPFIQELDSYFNNFKISLFTIPCYERIHLIDNKDWLLSISDKNMEFILHGYYHMNYEFMHLNQEQCDHFIDLGIQEFNKVGFNLIKGFKAPNWRYNDDLIKSLKKIGFWLAVYTSGHVTNEIPCYTWNWDIGQPIPKDVKVLHAHGHTHRQSGPGAFLGDCIDNIKKLPKDTEFSFVSESMIDRR